MASPVSIIITNHNYGRYIVEAVESALAQTIRCQVVVVDDGSTDDSIARLQPLVDRIDLVTKENGGQASAFNAGWSAANGSLILFLDGDDLLDPDAAEQVAEVLAADPEAVRCQFRLGWIDEHGAAIEGSFPEPERRLPAGDLRSRVLANPDDIPWQPTSGNAFTATLLDHLLPMPEAEYRISADHYLSNLSPLYGPVLAVEHELGRYRVHGANQDHRSAFDVARARAILVRTTATRQHMIDHALRLGLDPPNTADGFSSLTYSATRLVSFRLDGPHPFPDDRYGPLTKRLLVDAWSRADLSAGRRAMAVFWSLALAVAPKRLLGWVAGKGLTR